MLNDNIYTLEYKDNIGDSYIEVDLGSNNVSMSTFIHKVTGESKYYQFAFGSASLEGGESASAICFPAGTPVLTDQGKIQLIN